ncbi:MAG: hypothetical protein HUU06_05855 [Planctomycetaceae bacterium]|nr:hypothetical protein [Planctomycetaceae bacterium]
MVPRILAAFAVPVLAGALALGLAAHPARAARFTSHLDAIEAEAASRDGLLVGDLSREQKKEKTAYGKVLAALAGDTASLLEELKLAGKVAKILERALPSDPEMQELLDDAVDALETETGEDLADLELEVEAEPDSSSRDRADGKLVKAASFLQGSSLQALFFLRLKFLQKAILLTKPVVKFLDGPPPGGGGGGGGGGGDSCFPGTRTLAGGEFLTATYAPTTFTAGSVQTQFQTTPFFNARATYHRCTATLHEEFTVFFLAPPTVDTPYPYGPSSAIGVYYGRGEREGLTQTFGGNGTITFTQVDAATGTYAGTFTFSSGAAGVTVTEGSFKIVGLK